MRGRSPGPAFRNDPERIPHTSGVRLQPFPRPGERLAPTTPSAAKRPTPLLTHDGDQFWAALTIGGKIGVCLVGALGVIAVLGIGDDIFFGGIDGPNAAAVFGFYALIVVGLLLGIVLSLDAAFQAARQRLARRLR